MKLYFRNILVIQELTSASTSAMEFACNIARLSDSRVVCVGVQPPLSPIWKLFVDQEMIDVEVQEGLKKLKSSFSRFTDLNERVEFRIVRDRPISKIEEIVKSKNIHLVIKESKKAGDHVFSLSDQKLARNCEAPLLLTKPNSSRIWKHILVAVDPELDPVAMKLNFALVRQASAIARVHKSKISLIGAWHTAHFAFQYDDEYVYRFEAMEKQVRRKAWENLIAISDFSLLNIDKNDINLECGPVVEVITNAVSKLKPDLLVMGSVKSGEFSRMLVRRTCERVIPNVNCSILTFQPEKIDSPVVLEKSTRK